MNRPGREIYTFQKWGMFFLSFFLLWEAYPSSSSLLQMDLPLLVQRTLAGPMAHMGANTSPSPQARTYILQPSSCTTHKVMFRNYVNHSAARIRIAARHHSRRDLLSQKPIRTWKGLGRAVDPLLVRILKLAWGIWYTNLR